MKLLYAIIFFFTLILSSATEAQQQEIVWTKSLKNKGEIYPIGEHEGHYYVIRRSMFHVYLEKTNIQTMEIIFSEEMDAHHPEAPTKIGIVNAFLHGGVIRLFGVTMDQKSGESVLWTSSIKTDGTIIKKWGPSYRSKIQLSPFVSALKMSPDGAYFLWKVALNEGEGMTYKLITLNKELKEVWTGEIVIPVGQEQKSITDFEVNNSGHVFALVGSDPIYRGLFANKVLYSSKSRGTDYDPGKLGPVTLYLFDGVKQQSIALNKDNDRITLLNGSLTQDSTGSIIYMTGLYSNKSSEEDLKGAYSAKLSPDISYPKFSFSDLGQEFAGELAQKDVSFKHDKDFPAYLDRQTLIDRDGNIIIIGEFIHYLYYCGNAGNSNTYSCFYSVNWNSIFMIKLAKDGTLLWKKIIPKKSNDVKMHSEFMQSFAYRNNANGTDLVFLDERSNLTEEGERVSFREMKNPKKRTVLIRAHIDNHGEVTYTPILISSNKSMVPYLFKGSWQFDDRIIIAGISGMNSAKQHLGRISLK